MAADEADVGQVLADRAQHRLLEGADVGDHGLRPQRRTQLGQRPRQLGQGHGQHDEIGIADGRRDVRRDVVPGARRQRPGGGVGIGADAVVADGVQGPQK